MFTVAVSLFLIALSILRCAKSEVNILNSDGFLPRSYICQCYCSITDYDISSGVPVVTNLQYAPDVQVVLLPELGIQGIKKLNMDKLTRTNNKLTEFRIGTLGWYHSTSDLERKYIAISPEIETSTSNPGLDAVFSNVNQFSLDIFKVKDKTDLMFMQTRAEDVGNANLSDEELQNALFPTCFRACARPAARSQNYAYARMEFLELTTEGRISRQCPLTMPEYYQDIHQSIRNIIKPGICKQMSSTVHGIKTNWITVINELENIVANKSFNKLYIKEAEESSKDAYMLPKVYYDNVKSVLIPYGQILDRVKKMAYDILVSSQGKDIHLICTLKGARTFFSDLLSALIEIRDIVPEFNHQIIYDYYVRYSSYTGISQGKGSSVLGSLQEKDVELLMHKTVYVVEDIIDTGHTMNNIKAMLTESIKPKKFVVVTLVKKNRPNVLRDPVDYIGFYIPDVFIVGYGLDLYEAFRDLKPICVMDETKTDFFLPENRSK